MMRRAALMGAAIALAVVAMTPGASAAPDDWRGSAVTAPDAAPATVPDSSFAIRSLIVRDYDSRIDRVDASTVLEAPAEQEAGCTTTLGPTSIERQAGTNRHTATAAANVGCNGVYTAVVTAHLVRRGFGGEQVIDTYVLPDHTIHVAAPPPDVTAVATAPGDDRSVVVGWTPVANPPPDMLGYLVERVTASGDRATIATIDDPVASSYTDEDPPAEGGTTTYRVRARRAGPQGEVTSASAGEATAEVEPVPDPPDDPGTDPGGSGGGDGDGGGDGGAAGGGGPGGDPSPGTSGRSPFRPPTVGRSSGSVVPPLGGTVTTLDTGFEEELPFGDRELGSEDPVLPDDEFASMIYEDEAGRGLLIPIATGLLLAVWAVHLRYLAAAAKPE